MSKTVFGAELGKPSTQTILPVMGKPSARIYGFLLIPEETFDGTEVEYATADGNVPIETVTMSTYGVISGGRTGIGRVNALPVQQYVAAVWDDNDLVSAEGNRGTPKRCPWAGLTQFVSAQEGFFHRYIQASNSNFVERLQLGTLIDSLVFGMNVANSGSVPGPTPPDGSDAAMTWTAKIGQATLVGECPYFDFNWVTLFQSKYKVDEGTNVPVPMRMSITSVPAGFKAFLVNRPTVIPGTNLTYDTVRIVAIGGSDITTGDYEFEFLIETDQGSTPVTLTLTVTAAQNASTG